MKLTMEQAATRLGKSQRQVRYMIKKNELPAEKVGGRWWIDADDLPLSQAQRKDLERRERQFRAAVEDALDLPPESQRQRRYSVRDLKAYQITLPLYQDACQALTEAHPAARALRAVLEQLCLGCHRFADDEKASAYRDARDRASLAVCELSLTDGKAADGLLERVEQDLMAALAGLLRRIPSHRRRSGP